MEAVPNFAVLVFVSNGHGALVSLAGCLVKALDEQVKIVEHFGGHCCIGILHQFAQAKILGKNIVDDGPLYLGAHRNSIDQLLVQIAGYQMVPLPDMGQEQLHLLFDDALVVLALEIKPPDGLNKLQRGISVGFQNGNDALSPF